MGKNKQEQQNIPDLLNSYKTGVDKSVGIESTSEFKSKLNDELNQQYLMKTNKSRSRFSKKSRFIFLGGLSILLLTIFFAFTSNWFGGDSDGTPIIVRNDKQISGEISYLENIVLYKDSTMDEWSKAPTSLVITEEMEIKTELNSKIIVNLDDGSALRLDENSEISFKSLDPNNIEIEQSKGRVYARVIELDRKFTISTSNADYLALGTAFTVELSESSEVVTVIQSNVLTTFNSKEVEIKEGSYYNLNESIKDIDIEFISDDEFLNWNKEMDSQNPELKDKMGIFDEYEKSEENKEEELKEKDSNETTKQIEEPSNPVVQSPLILTGTASSSYGIKVTWDVPYGTDASNGYKVVYSKSPNPTYPENNAQYISNPDSRKALIEVFDGKTYYIRVCRYLSSSKSCDLYSSQSTVVAPSKDPKEVSISSILLSNADSQVSWTLSGTAPYGFKVVWAKSVTPIYGEHHAVYVTESSYTLDAYDGPGLYNVRVCAYLGNSACDPNYSNMLEIELD